MPETSERRGYVDWMRGIAVLIMIQTHVIDSWTRAASRSGQGFRNAVILRDLRRRSFSFSPTRLPCSRPSRNAEELAATRSRPARCVVEVSKSSLSHFYSGYRHICSHQARHWPESSKWTS
jgi:hypothetical protein